MDTVDSREGVATLHSMTIVVAAMTSNGPRMACDTLLTSDTGAKAYTEHKVFQPTKDFLVGVAGDLGMVNLIRLQVDYSKLTEKNVEKWIHTKFIPQVKALAAFVESVEGKQAVATESPQVAFLGRSGGLYEVSNTDCVEHAQVCCIGSGAEYAMGALWQLTSQPTEEDIRDAVRCAMDLSSFCGGEGLMRSL